MDFSLKRTPQNNSRDDLIKELQKSFDKTEDILKTQVKEINQYWNFVPGDGKEGRFPNEEETKRHNGKFLVCRADGELYIDTFLSDMARYGTKSSFVVIEHNNPVVKWMNLPDA